MECGGYNLVGVGANANNLTDALFSLFDVVYINYVPTSQFGSQDAHKLHNWLKTKKNRVLIASYDASDVSQNLLAEILAGKSGIKYFTSNGGPYPLAASTIGNHYLLLTDLLPKMLLSLRILHYGIMIYIMVGYR